MNSIDQLKPKDCYVYAHSDSAGRFFYIGKGTRRRAWSRDRDRMWHHYVNVHLGGVYSVVILADGLESDEAEALECKWIAKENERLINRQNISRSLNMEALARQEALSKRADALIIEAKALERIELGRAITCYAEAYSLLKTYSRIQVETGLYAKLSAELEPIGKITLLDRLTVCLNRASRLDEARQVASEYFSIFRSDRSMATARAIAKRVGLPTD